MKSIKVQYNHDFSTILGKLDLFDDYEGLCDLIKKGSAFIMSPIVHHDELIGVNISPQSAKEKETPYDRSSLVDILVYHWQTNTSGCGCGWGGGKDLGKSWPEHIANVYEESARARL